MQIIDIYDRCQIKHSFLFDTIHFPWDPLQKLKDYLNTFSEWGIYGDVSPEAFLVNREKIYIEEGATIEPGAYIQGPCIVGTRSVVRHGAYIRGNVIVGEDCVIGHDTEIKNSIMLNGAKAAHFAYVGDSILGYKCNLGAGVKLANLRLDRQFIKVEDGESIIDTGLKKFGAIVGDGVQIGCNSVLNPGTVIGKNSIIYPLVNIGGYIPCSSRVKAIESYSIKQIL